MLSRKKRTSLSNPHVRKWHERDVEAHREESKVEVERGKAGARKSKSLRAQRNSQVRSMIAGSPELQAIFAADIEEVAQRRYDAQRFLLSEALSAESLSFSEALKLRDAHDAIFALANVAPNADAADTLVLVVVVIVVVAIDECGRDARPCARRRAEAAHARSVADGYVSTCCERVREEA